MSNIELNITARYNYKFYKKNNFYTSSRNRLIPLESVNEAQLIKNTKGEEIYYYPITTIESLNTDSKYKSCGRVYVKAFETFCGYNSDNDVLVDQAEKFIFLYNKSEGIEEYLISQGSLISIKDGDIKLLLCIKQEFLDLYKPTKETVVQINREIDYNHLVLLIDKSLINNSEYERLHKNFIKYVSKYINSGVEFRYIQNIKEYLTDTELINYFIKSNSKTLMDRRKLSSDTLTKMFLERTRRENIIENE